jgi:hypothetical protein
MGRKVDANANSAFASATANAVQVAAQRDEAFGTDLHKIAGTSLDKDVEMDALINQAFSALG